jgi:hypothetical protein
MDISSSLLNTRASVALTRGHRLSYRRSNRLDAAAIGRSSTQPPPPPCPTSLRLKCRKVLQASDTGATRPYTPPLPQLGRRFLTVGELAWVLGCGLVQGCGYVAWLRSSASGENRSTNKSPAENNKENREEKTVYVAWHMYLTTRPICENAHNILEGVKNGTTFTKWGNWNDNLLNLDN